jgi:hypothetical protein
MPHSTLVQPTQVTQLQALQGHLNQLRANPGLAAAVAHDARGLEILLAALPPRYTEVLHNLLDRLESSALFAEESCSFSQTDLLDSLQMWVDKARAQLQQN